MFVENISRFQAFAIHFGISLLIFVFLLSIILFQWFPGEFFAFGAIHGISLIAGVDLVLGPGLTLAIYKAGKKGLKFDLMMIALVQVAALSYGVWTISQQKPELQVLSPLGLHIISSTEIDMYNTSLKGTPFETLEPPIKIHLELPYGENNSLSPEALQGTTPLSQRIEYFRSFDQQSASLSQILNRFNLSGDCYQMPVYSAHYKGYACLKPSTGEFEIIDDSEFLKKKTKKPQ